MDYPYQFETKVELLNFGRMAYSVVYLPKKTTQQLKLEKTPRLRVEGLINGTAYNGACTPTSDGPWYLLLSKRYLKQCRSAVGERVYVELQIADQDAVDVPEELRFALEANTKANDLWNSLTPGKQRGLAYRVSSAKRTETRERRVEEVIEELRSS